MKNDAYLLELMSTYRGVPENQKTDFLHRFNAQAYNPVVVFGFSVFLGALGVDRFLLGQVLLGILKLITAGGFGLWVIIDWFLVAGTTRERNLDIAKSIVQNSVIEQPTR